MSDISSVGNFVKHDYDSNGLTPRRQNNNVGTMLSRVTGHNGIRVRSHKSGIDIYGTALEDQFNRFRIQKFTQDDDNPGVRVLLGKWTRNGTTVTLELDSNVAEFESNATYRTLISLPTDSTFYVQIKIDKTGATGDDEEKWKIPTELKATIITSLPTVTDDPNNQIVVIGSITTASNVITDVTQFWLGDIDDLHTGIPDGDSDNQLLMWNETDEKCVKATVDTWWASTVGADRVDIGVGPIPELDGGAIWQPTLEIENAVDGTPTLVLKNAQVCQTK